MYPSSSPLLDGIQNQVAPIKKKQSVWMWILVGFGIVIVISVFAFVSGAILPKRQVTVGFMPPAASASSTTTRLPTETPLPSPTITPSPSPTPRPVTILWCRDAAMVPLRDEPGGKALGLTAQGSHITLDERVTDWACVTSGDVQGWVVDSCVYRVPYDQVSTLKYVTGTEGANLRQTTWGEVITWLAAGSPVLPTGETQDGWVEVTLLDGTKGWVASHLIGSK